MRVQVGLVDRHAGPTLGGRNFEDCLLVEARSLINLVLLQFGLASKITVDDTGAVVGFRLDGVLCGRRHGDLCTKVCGEWRMLEDLIST